MKRTEGDLEAPMSKRAIWKYEIPKPPDTRLNPDAKWVFEHTIPDLSTLLRIDMQQQVQEGFGIDPETKQMGRVRAIADVASMWFEVYPDSEKKLRKFQVFRTGDEITDGHAVYCGSLLVGGGLVVYHVYEIME